MSEVAVRDAPPRVDLAAELASFQRDGYLVVRGFWSPADCALIEREVRGRWIPCSGPWNTRQKWVIPGRR